jgi:hypothetical protein
MWQAKDLQRVLINIHLEKIRGQISAGARSEKMRLRDDFGKLTKRVREFF